MGTISMQSVTFYYNDSTDIIFKDLTLNIDTRWRLGLIGKNGRGKTTFLNLLNEKIFPVKGEINKDVNTFYFPYKPENSDIDTFSVIKENIAPFSYWERKMHELGNRDDKRSIAKLGEIMENYQSANGYEIDSMIEKEFSDLRMGSDLLKRNFSTLSGGEQTRALIISLFLRQNSFPLIDEPTDHLDMNGREILAEYLSKRNGFILVSHDRNFLDSCINHTLSINKSGVRLNKGNYSQWKYNTEIEEEFEKRRNENLKKEITSLEAAAKKGRHMSHIRENQKIGAKDVVINKGSIGHKSAKLMKRALQIELRINNKLEEKKSLLRNLEDKRKLKIEKEKKAECKVLSVVNAALSYNGKKVFENISIDVFRNERIALTGNNGCGKTSLINAIKKKIILEGGNIYVPGNVKICFADQNPNWEKGYLREYLMEENLDETRFRNILGAMGAWGELFERPLETFSKGQLKKVELAKSFLSKTDLLIWDEPLNYLDVFSREQLEEVILNFRPTMLFTEHDKFFIENIATGICQM